MIILTFAAEKLADHFGLDVPGQDSFWFGHGYRLLWMLVYSVCIVARAFLLLEPFLAMRSLPPGAYEDILWTDFLPHV